MDGNRGMVILNPDEETRERHETARRNFGTFATRLTELRELPAETKDKERIVLMGNIEFPQEAKHCLDRGADGVGLYRTEFLYLNKTTDPTETEHLDAYTTVVRTMGNKAVVIRTLDLGADKFASQVEKGHLERNPFWVCAACACACGIWACSKRKCVPF